MIEFRKYLKLTGGGRFHSVTLQYRYFSIPKGIPEKSSDLEGVWSRWFDVNDVIAGSKADDLKPHEIGSNIMQEPCKKCRGTGSVKRTAKNSPADEEKEEESILDLLKEPELADGLPKEVNCPQCAGTGLVV